MSQLCIIICNIQGVPRYRDTTLKHWNCCSYVV